MRQNGVTMPQAGGKTRAPWDIATRLSEQLNRPATRDEVLKACEAAGIAKGTRETQYSHWKKYHGLTGRVVPTTKNAAPAAPPTAPEPTAPNSVNVSSQPAPQAPAPPPPPHNPQSAPPGVPGEEVYNSKEHDISDAGWDAYCEGKNLSDNPHPPDSRERELWDYGWNEAKKA